LKNSAKVPDVAGASGVTVDSAVAGAEAAAVEAAGVAAVSAAAAAAAVAVAVAGVCGVTVTVCVAVTVAVAAAGVGGTGCTGSAEALAPVKPSTATDPAATPPTNTRQWRAILFIADDLFVRFGLGGRLVLVDCMHVRDAGDRAGIDLEPTPDRHETQLIPRRCHHTHPDTL